MSEFAIEAINVSKRFGEQVDLSRTNLMIEHGKIVWIVGRNGSGKTVLLHRGSNACFFRNRSHSWENDLCRNNLGFYGWTYHREPRFFAELQRLSESFHALFYLEKSR